MFSGFIYKKTLFIVSVPLLVYVRTLLHELKYKGIKLKYELSC